MRARYYNVSIKRFINQDVINGSITNSQSLNKFSYVQGNPIKLTDPFGLFPCISLSGIGHAVLDLLGIIPGLDFCDAINAVWYYLEGDYANAALSTVAILPMLGSMAGNGIKWGVKAGTKADKAADTIKLGSKFNGNGKGFMVSGDQTLDTVKNLHKEYAKTGEAITWSETGDFSKLGLKVAKMGNAGAAISENGPVLRHMSRGQDVAEAAPLSNATRKVASESGNEIRTLYRGDKEKMNPDIVFKDGFKAKGTHNDALLHHNYNSHPGNFVSTSKKSTVADDYATSEGIHNGYVYIIHTDNYIDINAKYGNDVSHPHDYEFLIPGGIKPSEIEGAYKIGRDYSIGEFISNPNFGGN